MSDRFRGIAPWIGIGATLAFTAWTIAVSEGWLDMELPFDLYYTAILANIVMVAGILFGWLIRRTRTAHN